MAGSCSSLRRRCVPAFFQFLSLNQLTARQLYRFNDPCRRTKRFTSSALDRLFRRASASTVSTVTPHPNGKRELGCGSVPLMETAERQSRQPDTSDAPYLTLPEIQWIERQMNRMLIEEDAALVHGESQLHVGQVPCRGSRGSMRKIFYVIRYGMVFELEPMTRGSILKGSTRDFMFESHNRAFYLLRYDGLTTNPRTASVDLVFCHRLDLARTWSVPLANFTPRRLFAIQHISPLEGFSIREWSPFEKGVVGKGKRGMPPHRGQNDPPKARARAVEAATREPLPACFPNNQAVASRISR